MNAGSGLGLPGARQPRAAHALRVVVAARDELDRRRLAHVLEREGFVVLGSADDPTEASRAEHVAVVHVENEPRDAAAVRRPEPAVSRIAVVRRNDRAAVEDALMAGAAGVVVESEVDERLGPTVRAVAVGQLAIPARHREAVARPILSPRERQVMSMVVLGFTNLEVANKLHVTETTVKSHLSSAYRKLRVRSRHEATALILSDRGLGLGILTLAGERSSD